MSPSATSVALMSDLLFFFATGSLLCCFVLSYTGARRLLSADPAEVKMQISPTEKSV